MNNTTKTILGVIVVVVLVWAGYAMYQKPKSENKTNQTSQTKQTSQSGPYKIGVLLPLTGDAASYGEPGQKVYQMAVDEINSSGGANGQNLQLVVEDSKCTGKDSANAMQKLVNVDKVQVVIGGFCSSESLAAVPIAETSKVAMLSAASSSPDLTGKSTYFARNYPSDSSQGAVLAEVAYNKESITKVAFIQEQTDYPLGIYKAFNQKFTALGGTVTKQEFPSSTTDFRTVITKAKAENPDALFVDTQAPAGAQRILKQLAEAKWKTRLIINDTTAGDPKTIQDNKALLEKALTAEFGVDSSNAKFQLLLKNYKQKFGADLPFQSYGQTEYDAPFIVRDAIVAVGYDGTKIANWLHGSVNNWQGASGNVTIGSDGDLVGGHKAEIIMGGKVMPYTK